MHAGRRDSAVQVEEVTGRLDAAVTGEDVAPRSALTSAAGCPTRTRGST